MRVSIVIPVLDSHEIVARQVKHWRRMGLSDDVEFILVDDGSDPPLNITDYDLRNLRIHATNDKRPWTQALARNVGAALAQGEYLFFTDIDHILSGGAIKDALKFTGDRMMFYRYFGVLLEDGTFSQGPEILEEYGLDMRRLSSKRGLYASVHGNTLVIKAETFHKLGGYDPRCSYGHRAPPSRGEDARFNAVWNRYARANGIKVVVGSPIYLFPNGRYHTRGETNPMGLWHNLSFDWTLPDVVV